MRTVDAMHQVVEQKVRIIDGRLTQERHARALAEIQEILGSAAPARSKVRKLNRLVDGVMAQVSDLSPCKKGCSHCCHIPVNVRLVEAQNIARQTGVKMFTPIYESPRDPMSFSMDTPCPFLQKNACSIYEHRPLVCRTYLSLDKDEYWCRHENWDEPIPSLRVDHFQEAMNIIQLQENGKLLHADIRDYFGGGS